MSLSQIFKKVLIPCAAGVSNAGGAESHTYGSNCVKKNPPGTKPSDLPIYSKECTVCRQNTTETVPPNNVEETVGNIRRELWVWQDNLKGYRHKIVDVYRRGFSKADSAIDYLREPSHKTHRVGAIAISGLAGYILAIRHGKFRKFLYGTVGAAGMASICYPVEASEILESAVLQGRRYFIIAYHFIYGEAPKVPEWLEKFTGSLGSKEAEPQTKETILDKKNTLPDEVKKGS